MAVIEDIEELKGKGLVDLFVSFGKRVIGYAPTPEQLQPAFYQWLHEQDIKLEVRYGEIQMPHNKFKVRQIGSNPPEFEKKESSKSRNSRWVRIAKIHLEKVVWVKDLEEELAEELVVPITGNGRKYTDFSEWLIAKQCISLFQVGRFREIYPAETVGEWFVEFRKTGGFIPE